MISDTYELNGIDLNVYYAYVPDEKGDYLQPSYKGYVEILSVWLPSDPLKTNIMQVIAEYDIDAMEEFFFEQQKEMEHEK